MARPSRRTRFRPLRDDEFAAGVVTGDETDWPGVGVYVPTPGPNDQWKQPVRFAATGDEDLATIADGDTVDGITIASGDRGLFPAQADDTQNGIYIVGASAGDTVRASDMDDDDEVVGARIFVVDGTANGGTEYRATNIDPPVIDVDSITFAQLTSSGGTLTVEELDGAPTVSPVDTIKFHQDDFTVTDNADGSVTIIADEPDATAHLADAADAHDASAISVLDSGGHFAATDVEAALAALATESITLGLGVGDGSAVVTTGGPKAEIIVPAACTVTLWQTRSIDGTTTTSTFDIKRRAHGGGAAASLIGAGTKPNISGATEGQSAPSGWTSVALAALDQLTLHVDSNSAGKFLGVSLIATRT